MAHPGPSPGPAWENLSLDHWYRFSTSNDFTTNEVTGASITDLTTGTTTTAPLSGVYLEGGTPGGAGAPTGFRFFAGGGFPGNITAWDNFRVVPSRLRPCSCAALCWYCVAANSSHSDLSSCSLSGRLLSSRRPVLRIGRDGRTAGHRGVATATTSHYAPCMLSNGA